MTDDDFPRHLRSVDRHHDRPEHRDPALIAYMYLRRRIEVLVLELEKHTNEVLTRLYRKSM